MRRALLGLGIVALLCACANPQIRAQDRRKPVDVPIGHPTGFSAGEILEVFTQDGAPSFVEYEGCETKLFKSVAPHGFATAQERLRAAQRIVKERRVDAHWCFYVRLAEFITAPEPGEQELLERRSGLIDTFSMLSPLAKAFFTEYMDPNYILAAGQQFQKLSAREYRILLEYAPEFTQLMTQYWRTQSPLREMK
jgi:hypothetical protein